MLINNGTGKHEIIFASDIKEGKSFVISLIYPLKFDSLVNGFLRW